MEKELLQKLVEESNSIKEILEKLNLKITGDNYKRLYKKLDEYEIEYSKVRNNSIKGTIRNRYDLKDILVENSSYCHLQRLKQRLIKEGLKEDICEICGQSPFHNGKKLVLQIHHINGVHNDNRLENLQIVCPNCHSQTDNYSGGNNTRTHNFCEKCGKEISKRAHLCPKCLGEKRRKADRPSKEELLNLIKTASFCEVGRMYEVSDNAIRKWCKNYGLPTSRKEIKKLLENK